MAKYGLICPEIGVNRPVLGDFTTILGLFTEIIEILFESFYLHRKSFLKQFLDSNELNEVVK